MAMLAGKNGSTTGAADRVAAKAVFENGAFLRDAVNVWGLVDGAIVSADGPVGQVVGENENDIWFFFLRQKKQRHHQRQ